MLLLAHTVRHLGDLHRDADRLSEADRCYSEALSLYPTSASPRHLDFANALRKAQTLQPMGNRQFFRLKPEATKAWLAFKRKGHSNQTSLCLCVSVVRDPKPGARSPEPDQDRRPQTAD